MRRLTPHTLVVVVLLACAAIVACLLGSAPTSPADAATAGIRYQIEAEGENAWMVDSATGRVWFCDEGVCRELPVTGLHPRPSS